MTASLYNYLNPITLIGLYRPRARPKVRPIAIVNLVVVIVNLIVKVVITYSNL